MPNTCWNFPKSPIRRKGPHSARSRLGALVSWRGNQYSVPPDTVGSDVLVRWRLGSEEIHIQSSSGRLLATHRQLPEGQGHTVRLPAHARALENVVLANFSSDRPCKRKANRPPSAAALALAAGIGGPAVTVNPPIDLGVYQRYIDKHRRSGR